MDDTLPAGDPPPPPAPTPAQVTFALLLEGVRAGDQNAARELIRRYEPIIRVTVRARLTDSRLRRVMDTMDMSQSVLAGFFVRAAVGEYDLNEPTDLVKLLVKMTHNKIATQYRYHFRGRRDVRRTADVGEDGMDQFGGAHPPEQVAAGRELLSMLRGRLNDEERAIADGRGAGKSWQEIADELGGTPEARRKQLARAIDRAAPDLGLDREGTMPDEAASPADRYRDLWHRSTPPSVAAFVADAGKLSAVALADVLRIDQLERWRRNDRVPAEWYFEQFPLLGDDTEGSLLVIYGEVLARGEVGETPTLEEFTARFPQFDELLALQWEVHLALEEAEVTDTIVSASPRGRVPASVIVPGYEVECEVGRGAVGVVYRARQLPLNRLVALKVVLEGAMARPEKLVRFLDEARVIARLRHPHIVGIYDLGNLDSGPFMALEWVGGGTLADKLAAGPLDPPAAAKLLATIAKAVGYAHQAGVIHRDIKPSNILITDDDQPKVADFGLAKHLELGSSGATATGVPIGTPQYMAPEQTRGKKGVGPPADVYALGAVLYECLTGRAPLVAATIADTLRLVAEQEPASPRQLNALVPRDLATVCMKCLEKDPAKRYRNAHDMADDLDRFLDAKPVAARPVSVVERAWRWGKKHRGRAAAIAGGVVVFTAAAAGLIALNVRLADERTRAETAERLIRSQYAADRDRLWRSFASEARALRRSGRPGQRREALEKIAEAQKVLVELGGDAPPEDVALLRTEAAACLALADAEPAGGIALPPGLRAVAVSGNLRRAAGQAADGAVSVRETTGEVGLLPSAGGVVADGVALSFDGRFAARAVPGPGGTVRHQVWRVGGDRPAFETGPADAAGRVAFHPTEAIAAVPLPGGGVAIVDADTGDTLQTVPSTRAGRVSFRPRANQLGVLGGDRFELYDAGTGALLKAWPQPGARWLGWHPGGEYYAVEVDRQAYFVRGDTGRPAADPLPAFAAAGGVFAFAPGGRFAAAADPGGVLRLWDLPAGRAIFSAPGHLLAGAAFGPDGVTLGGEPRPGRVGAVRFTFPADYREFGGRGVPAVDPAGRFLAVAAADGVRLLDALTGADFGRLPEVVADRRPLAFGTDGGAAVLLTVGAGGAARWPIHADRLGPPRPMPNAAAAAVAVTPDGKTLVAGGRAFGPPGGMPLELPGVPNTVAVSPDGRWVLAGGAGWREVVLVDATTGKRVLAAAADDGDGAFAADSARFVVRRAAGGGAVWKLAGATWAKATDIDGDAFAFAPDGTVAAAVGFGVVRLLDPDSGRPRVQLEVPAQTRLTPAGFAAGGAVFVAAGAESRAIHRWDLHGLRAALAALNLDWAGPPLPAPPAESAARPEIDEGGDVTALRAEAARACDKFDYRRAAALAARVLAADPADRTSRLVLSQVHIRGGPGLYDPAKAAALAEGLVNEVPNDHGGRRQLGVVRFHQLRFAAAADELTRGLAGPGRRSGPYYWGYLAAARLACLDIAGAVAAEKEVVMSSILRGVPGVGP